MRIYLNFPTDRRGALITILVLAVGSISIIGTSKSAMGQDGNNLLNNILGGCIYGACENTKITGNTTNGILAGCVFAGCKDTEISNEPTPNTATLIVTKEVVCIDPTVECALDKDFTISVNGENPSPQSFQGSASGTEVTLGSGAFTVSETTALGYKITFSGDCVQDSPGSLSASGNINAGETKECTVKNTKLSGQ